MGRLDSCMAALESEPANRQNWLNYIFALLEEGQPDAAREVLSLAVAQGLQGADADLLAQMLSSGLPAVANRQNAADSPRPDQIDSLASLFAEGHLPEAESLAKSMMQRYPSHGFGAKVLGAIYRQTGRREEALVFMRKSVILSPNDADAHSNLGFTLQELGRLSEACASCRRALEINPDFAEAHNNLGITLQSMGRLSDAKASFARALQIRPDYAQASNNLGNALLDMGQPADALSGYRRALELKPDYADAHSNLIFTLDLTTHVDTASLQQERKKWNAQHAAHLHRKIHHANVPDPERRLRVGYVSGDLRMHSAAFAFGAMLIDFDRDNFDVIAYSNSKKEDGLTEQFRHNVTQWRNISGLSDDKVADLIMEDGIDILVDLSGHSSGNRLLVFARKPAPVQVTGWGYAAGTGMDAMDVLFSDPVFIPPDERSFYAEEVRYLPCAIGYFHHCSAPGVNALPALSANGVTFGSFNRLVKNSEATYHAWIQVLQACPRSRLIVKTPELDDDNTKKRLTEYFAKSGLSSERLVLLGSTPRDAHIAAYNRIDIALDPFPHGGGVTALEGLMMGVPQVTLRWPTLTGRVSASIMTALGLCDWIAETPQQYVELAIQKACDLQSLSALRGRLRDIFSSSVIGDQAAYVRIVEREYRQLWREWCASHRDIQ